MLIEAALLAWLAPAGPAAAQATLVAVGDIRLDGPVGAVIKNDPGAATRGVSGHLEGDILFGNLECSVTRRGEKQDKQWTFRAPPASLAALDAAGFDIVSVANNHVWDYGMTGFLDTLRALDKAGIPFVGGGKTLEEAEGLRVLKAGGLRVGFLGFTSTHPRQAWAGPRKPGVAYSDLGRLPSIVSAAKKRCDVLIVSFHGGTELAEEPNAIQRAVARAAAEAGADLFLGHHPHVLQAVDLIAGRPVLYSLGNFLFVSPTPRTRWTVIARAAISERGVERVDFVPVDVNGGRPVPAGEEGRRIIAGALDTHGALSRHPDRFRLLSPPGT